MKLPVFKAFGATFAVVFGNFIDMVKIIWLPMALLLGLFYFLGNRMFGAIDNLLEIRSRLESGQQPDPHVVLQAMQPIMGSAGLVLLAEIILFPMIFAGVLRFVIRDEKPGIFYLRFGGDEFRILITFILLILLMVGVSIGGGIIVALAGAALSAAPPVIAGIGGAVLGIAFCIFIIWVMLRLSLSIPAAVGARQIGIGPSWSATKGAVWSLFFYFLLWFIVIAVIEAIFAIVAMPGYVQSVTQMMQLVAAHAGDPEAIRSGMVEIQRHMMNWFASHIAMLSIAGFVLALVLYPLMIASGGIAYRMLTESKAAGA